MGEPKLYERYDRHEAVALFGPEGDARSLCDSQWVVFPGVVLAFVEVGEPPRASHFINGGEFCWVAENAYRVNDDEHIKFVPREVVAGHAEDRTIHLFARKTGSGPYLHIGRLRPACRFTLKSDESCGKADFSLSPALPSDIWVKLGGRHPGDLDHAVVDAALARLHPPTNLEERLWVLRQLVGYWHGPIRPEDGFDERELGGQAIPYPLRWWYGWAGRRSTIMRVQNSLLDPDELRVLDGRLEFYVESQYCYQWGTLLEGDDPPVFGRSETRDPWEPEGITLSEHLILACLFEVILCHSPYGAWTAWLEEDRFARIVEHLPPIAINPGRWAGSMRFYAKGGAFMHAGAFEIDGKRGYSVRIGAKTEHPLQNLKPYIDEDWEYIAV
jgi:hypothetical protein